MKTPTTPKSSALLSASFSPGVNSLLSSSIVLPSTFVTEGKCEIETKEICSCNN